MKRKVKRTDDFEIVLEIRNDGFIRPPKDAQRDALLTNAVSELGTDLEHLDKKAKGFAAGGASFSLDDRTQKALRDEEIMEDWQIPVMKAMAETVTESGGEILEIGFGRGIASTLIQESGVRSHTIIECNDGIVKTFYEWRRLFEKEDINLVHGLWQDTIGDLGLFDGIFFHTYPLNENEYLEYVHKGVTFAEHFFETAAHHLRPGGVFTYFSNEIDSLSRGHQRSLLRHFSSVSLKVIDLDIPADVVDTWWADSMVIIRAAK
jgi:guanidinoacetate N-methyltransferase